MAKPRRRSRFLTVLLCLCLLANLVPVQAMAAEAVNDQPHPVPMAHRSKRGAPLTGLTTMSPQ